MDQQRKVKVIVTVHGTGLNTRDFANDHISAVAAALGWTPPHLPVFWGDLIDAGSLLIAGQRRAMRWLRQRSGSHGYLALLQRSLSALEPAITILHGLIDSIAGVVSYFLMPRRRRQIYERLQTVLSEASSSSSGVILLTHSLGCLVAFDVLSAAARDYNVAAWVSLGCPLAIMFRTVWRHRGLGALTPATVPLWYNLYNKADPIAGAISTILPSGTVSDRQMSGNRHPLQAHRYWDSPELARLVADLLRSQAVVGRRFRSPGPGI